VKHVAPTIPAVESPATTTVRSPAIAKASGNTFGYLVRFALANIRRRPERFVLSVLGIALAIACVTVVRTISSSFAITGADSVTDVLNGAQLWAVPAAGVHYDPDVQALVADGATPELTLPAGWTGTRTLSGATTVNGTSVSLRGNDQTRSGQATFGSALAGRLGSPVPVAALTSIQRWAGWKGSGRNPESHARRLLPA